MSVDRLGLLPCPFCGGEAETFFVTGCSFHFWTKCKGCGIRYEVPAREHPTSKADKTWGSRDPVAKQKAIDLWNTRS